MQNPFVRINTDDSKEIEIIEKYWQLDERLNFKYLIKNIAQEFQLTIPSLSEIIDKSSFNVVCSDCGRVIISDSKRYIVEDFKSFAKGNQFYCKNCKAPLIIDQKADKLIERNALKLLDEETIKTLIACAFNDSPTKALNVGLRGIPSSSPYSKPFWGRINNLVSKHFLLIERENTKITAFLVNEKIKNQIKIDFPQYFDNNTSELIKSVDKLDIKIPVEIKKNKESGAIEVKGWFSVNEEIVLPHSVSLRFNAVFDDEGNMSLKIFPDYKREKRD